MVLYSGGKDSSFIAHTLDSWGYDVQLITANFGVMPDIWKTAAGAAKILDFPHEVIQFDRSVIEEAAEIAQKDGFPLNAINHVHHHVIEEIAKKYHEEITIIADGGRRDDRTPRLKYPTIQSLEARYKIEYFNMLGGLCHKTIKYLTDKLFQLELFWAGSRPTSEYETEIRAVLREKGGEELEKSIFPSKHNHSLLVGKNNGSK